MSKEDDSPIKHFNGLKVMISPMMGDMDVMLVCGQGYFDAMLAHYCTKDSEEENEDGTTSHHGKH